MSETRWRSALRLSAALALLVLLVPLVPPAGVAVADHGSRTLDLTPETSKAALRAKVRLRATLKDASGDNPSPANLAVTINFEIDGPGDPTNDGKSLDTPDRTCRINPGETGCRRQYGNPTSNTGPDTIWAWIGDTPPDETEGQSIGTSPGSQPEPPPDGTDVVTATWFTGLPASATLDCNPEVSTTTVRSSKTFTCDVRNQGAPLNGWEIDAENLSPAVNDPDNSATGHPADYMGDAPQNQCVTGESAPGQCRMTIPSETPAQAGQARICFWVDEENDNSFHPKVDVEWDGALCDTETVTARERDNRTDKVALSWKHRRTVSLRSSKSQVRRGRKFRLSGVIKRTSGSSSTCLASQRVLIRRNVFRDGNPNYVLFRSLRTDADGRYRTKVRGKRSANYKASAIPTSKCYGTSSPGRTVRVKR